MSEISAAGAATEPRLAGLRRDDSFVPTRRALEFSRLPMLISVIINVAFFVAYWLPELGRGSSDPLLAQLAPMASALFATGGEPWFSSQRGIGTWLLIFGVAIAALAPSRFWIGRLLLFPLSYLGAALSLVMIIGLVVRGELSAAVLGALAAAIWVVAALITSWRSLWVDVSDLPPPRAARAWPLVICCVIVVVPLAVGRRVFAPGLRDAAALVAVEGSSMRWAALFTDATPRLFLAGIAVLVAGWAFWRLLPHHRPARPAPTVIALVVALVLGLGVVGISGARLAAERAQQLLAGDLTPELLFTCASWAAPPPAADEPRRTLVSHGSGCRQLTAYAGFVTVSDRELGVSLSRVRAVGPTGADLEDNPIAVTYGSVVVVAATGRSDDRADRLLGLRLTDGSEAWAFPCAAAEADELGIAVRFAGSDAGEDPATGRQTRAGEVPSIVVGCGGLERRLDPQTGALLN